MSSAASALFRRHWLDTLLLLVPLGLALDVYGGCGCSACNWMEGVQLLAVYLILGLAFYFLPATP